MHANVTVQLAMYGWIPFTLLLFMFLQPRKAVLVSMILGICFLPQATIPIRNLPEFTKLSAISLGAFLGVVLFDQGRLLSLRPSWLDLPVLIWCLCPFASSMANGLGPYDGVSAAYQQTMYYGIPWVLGRVYFVDGQGLASLALGIFIGGLIYVPFCLYEIRMSPQLHNIVYGYFQHNFSQTVRLGGYRPTVFMQHGLMVGMWMTAATLCGWWLYYSGTLRRLWGLPLWTLLFPLLITTILCRALTGLLFLALGLAVFYAMRWFRTSIPMIIIMLIAPLYMTMQLVHPWSGEPAVSIIRQYVDADRAKTLEGRLWKETLFLQRASQRPLFGWGGWDRMNPVNPLSWQGKKKLGVDGMWYTALGSTGWVGLIGFACLYILPGVVFAWRFRPYLWVQPGVAIGGVLALLVTLYMLDNLLNAMLNPVYILAAGGVAGFALRPELHRRPVPLAPFGPTHQRRARSSAPPADLQPAHPIQPQGAPNP